MYIHIYIYIAGGAAAAALRVDLAVNGLLQEFR